MTENKKVIGATECEVDGIRFKSKWECKVYQMLKEAGLNPQYEGLKIQLLALSGILGKSTTIKFLSNSS